MADEEHPQQQHPQEERPALGGAVGPPQPPRGQGGGGGPQVVYAQPPGYGEPPRRRFGIFRWLVVFVLLVIAFIAGLIGGVGLLFAPAGLQTRVHQSGDPLNTIAVVPVEGAMDVAQSQFVTYALRELEKRDEVKAVVLRVNSPGGYVSPSDEIARAVRSMQQSGRKVVASYGDIAASGGYYCSVLADEIYAQPTTLTGSIGVIGQALVLADLMEKVGVEPIVMVADGSPMKDLANQTYEAWTNEDKAEYQRLLNWYYDQFFNIVEEGRGEHFESEEALRSVCNGLAYPAPQALELKLIDAIGYLDEAIDRAGSLAGMSDPDAAHVIYVQPPVTLPWPLGPLARNGGTDVRSQRGVEALLDETLDADRLRLLAQELSRPRAMYLMR
jgi:protease-4